MCYEFCAELKAANKPILWKHIWHLCFGSSDTLFLDRLFVTAIMFYCKDAYMATMKFYPNIVIKVLQTVQAYRESSGIATKIRIYISLIMLLVYTTDMGGRRLERDDLNGLSP